MSAAKALTSASEMTLTTKANDVAMAYIGFRESIKKFTLNSKRNKNSSTNNTKRTLKEDTDIIFYQSQKLEKALKEYAKINKEFEDKLSSFIKQIYDFRVHMLSKIQSELQKPSPQFLYKAKRANNFQQNLRNNITMRKTRPKNIVNSATGQISKQVEYISLPRLDRVLEEILPPREYSKIHPNSSSAAANTDGPASLFGPVEGGRRKTYKRIRRHTRRN